MARFNYVTLVSKEVEIKTIRDKSFKGKVKQVFDDVIVLENSDKLTTVDIYLKKEDIISITV